MDCSSGTIINRHRGKDHTTTLLSVSLLATVRLTKNYFIIAAVTVVVAVAAAVVIVVIVV